MDQEPEYCRRPAVLTYTSTWEVPQTIACQYYASPMSRVWRKWRHLWGQSPNNGYPEIAYPENIGFQVENVTLSQKVDLVEASPS
jgi:hypothetical protein